MTQATPHWSAVRPPWRRHATAHAATVAGVTVVVTVARILNDVFFGVGDRVLQYMPVFADIGRRLRDGEFPIIDPVLGSSGNYALDLQYGLFMPDHLLASLAISTTSNVYLAATLLSAVYLIIFATGTCAVALRFNATPWWGAAIGVTTATSGFVLYALATSWIAGLISMAWLPWFWWALTARSTRWWNMMLIAAATYLCVGGGWPATWAPWCLVVVGYLVETAWIRRDELAGRWRRLIARVLAIAAGATAAAITALPLALAADYTIRTQAIENTNRWIPNLADIVAFASPTLHGEITGYDGTSRLYGPPIFWGVWFAAVLLWMVRWSSVAELLRRRGMMTALIGLVGCVMFTQLPGSFGPLRNPYRGLAGIHFFLAIFIAVVAFAVPLVWSRGRIIGAAVSLACVWLLTWFRAPDEVGRALAVGLVVLAAAALVVAVRRWGLAAAGAVALVCTVALSTATVALHPDTGRGDWRYQEASSTHRLDIEQPAMVVALAPRPRVGRRNWHAEGFGAGFSSMTENYRLRPGYSSIRQSGLEELLGGWHPAGHMTRGAVEGLLSREETTGLPWYELLGLRTIVLQRGQPVTYWRNHRPDGWRKLGQTRSFLVFEHAAYGKPGRVTAQLGDADVTSVSVGNRVQQYRVSSDDGATLVFSDLYWPGYTATLGGEELDVEPLGDTLVSVRIPAGADGTLELSYLPLPMWMFIGVPVSALALLGGAIVMGRKLYRGEDDNEGEDADVERASEPSREALAATQ